MYSACDRNRCKQKVGGAVGRIRCREPVSNCPQMLELNVIWDLSSGLFSSSHADAHVEFGLAQTNVAVSSGRTVNHLKRRTGRCRNLKSGLRRDHHTTLFDLHTTADTPRACWREQTQNRRLRYVGIVCCKCKIATVLCATYVQ